MSDMNSPEKSPWGWKAAIIATILSCLFLGFFYIAMSNEPDYMPSQQRAKNHANMMSNDAVAEKDKTATHSNDMMQMSDDDMQSMQNHSSNTEHSH